MNGARSRIRSAMGFTLVEVLVSIAIFAIAAVVLATAYLNVLGGYRRIRASAPGDGDLAFVRSIVLAEPSLEVVEKGGEMRRPDNSAVRWSVEVEPTHRADLFRVSLDCEFPAVGNAAPVHLRDSFLVLRPTWSDPAEREKLRAKFREELARRNL